MASRKSSRRSQRSSRRANRKNRKDSRKNRKSSRKGSRRQRGGAYNASALSLAQGQQYLESHRNQHGGGGYQSGGYAPVGDQGLLPADLRTMARVSPLDGALDQIKGMSDLPQAAPQSGGGVNVPPPPPTTRRRRGSRRGAARKTNRRNRRNSRKNRRCWTRRRRQSGGFREMLGAPVSAPGMLLTPAEAARAGTADFSDPLLRGR